MKQRTLALAAATGVLAIGLPVAIGQAASGTTPDRTTAAGTTPQDGGRDRGPRGERRAEMEAALAKELGVSAEKLRAAHEAAHQELKGSGNRPTPAAEDKLIAEKLGISVEKLTAAREAVGMPAGGPRGGHGRHGGGPRGERAAALAKALGVSEAKLREAREAVRKQAEASGERPDPAETEAALAKQLGVSVEKLRSARETVGPPEGGPRGRGGRGDCAGKPGPGPRGEEGSGATPAPAPTPPNAPSSYDDAVAAGPIV